MKPEDLNYTLTFKLTDDGIKKIDELNKEQLEEAKKLIDKALEDYDKPKGIQDVFDVKDYVYIQMGSEEEAGKAVEKVRAWKRLEEKGFRFEMPRIEVECSIYEKSAKGNVSFCCELDENVVKDLKLLFGGEE